MLGCRSQPQLWERVAAIETDRVAIKTVLVETDPPIRKTLPIQ